MNNKTLKDNLFYILAALVLFGVAIFGSYMLSSYTKQMYIEENKEKVIGSYNTVYNQYKKLADIVFNTKINTDEVREIFKDAQSSTNKDQVRNRLLEKLQPMYELLKDQNIRQLHFHLKDNDSFLRFHKPEKFGDNLTNIRSTVAYVNKNKKPIDSFEEGRVYNGFRFVYPLFYN